MERAFDAALPKKAEAYAPYYTAMVDAAASVYANNFTVDELREIEAFYSRPAGKKLLEKSQPIAHQNTQVDQETGSKATEALRAATDGALGVNLRDDQDRAAADRRAPSWHCEESLALEQGDTIDRALRRL